eukprot:392675-Heterocapsa_arctica.AAC.1
MAIPYTGRCAWLKACLGRPPGAPLHQEPAGETGEPAAEVPGEKGVEEKRVQHSGPRRGTAHGRRTSAG